MANGLVPNFYGVLGTGSKFLKLGPGVVARLSDAAGAETVTLGPGAQLDVDGVQGANRWVLEGWSSSMLRAVWLPDVQKVGLQAMGRFGPLVQDAWLLTLPVLTNVPQTLVFGDGQAVLTRQGGQLRLGDTPILDSATAFVAKVAESLAPAPAEETHILQPNVWGSLAPQAAPWHVGAGVVAKLVDVVGEQTVVIEKGGKLDLDSAMGSNTVVFEDYRRQDLWVYRFGQELQLVDRESLQTVAFLPATTTPQTLRFTDVEQTLRLQQGVVMLGQEAVAADVLGPRPTGIVWAGPQIFLDFDAELDPLHPPALAGFAVQVNQQTRAWADGSALWVQGHRLCLSLQAPLSLNDQVLLSYRDPTAGNDRWAVQDTQGNDALSFDAWPVSPDTTPPVFLSPTQATAHEGQNRLYQVLVSDGFKWDRCLLGGPDASALALAADGTVTLKTGVLGFGGPAPKTEYVFDITAFDVQQNASTQTVSVSVNHLPQGRLLVQGVARQGETLWVDTAAISDADGSLSGHNLQWFADGLPIPGAIDVVCTLTEAEVGRKVSAVLSYTDDLGQEEVVGSAPTSPVTNLNDDPTGEVWLEGVLQPGQTLQANWSDLQDLDGLGTFRYQWWANQQAIPAATAEVFRLTQAQVGQVVQLEIRYTDGHGTPETVWSWPTDPVSASPLAAMLVGVSNQTPG